mgnify:CR=1 FL=1
MFVESTGFQAVVTFGQILLQIITNANMVYIYIVVIRSKYENFMVAIAQLY